MRTARPFLPVSLALLVLLVVHASAPIADAQPSMDEAAADLSAELALIRESNASREASDYATAREKASEATAMLLARPTDEQDDAWDTLLFAAGWVAWEAKDSRTANTAWTRVYEVRRAKLPIDHADLQAARGNLASSLLTLGDIAGARAMQEEVLEVLLRTMPDDHPQLQIARGNLAITLISQGDLAGARVLQEKVLEVRSQTGPDDHASLQDARQNLAGTLYKLGDLLGARALDEKVLEARSRTLPDAHPDLQAARQNLAGSLRESGDHAAALALAEKVLEVHLRTLPDDHPELQLARASYALNLSSMGKLADARALQEKVLEVHSRTMPDDHPVRQTARQGLALTLTRMGHLTLARALFEEALEVSSRTRSNDSLTQDTREHLALTIAKQLARVSRSRGVDGENGGARGRTGESDEERCADLIRAVCRASVHVARVAIASSPAREAEERCAHLTQRLDVALSFARGLGVFDPRPELDPEVFALAEATRGAALTSSRLTRRAARSPEYSTLRDALRAASDALAALARKGATNEEFDRARVRRESVERDLVALARELSGESTAGEGIGAASLATRLSEREAAVGFRRFSRAITTVVDEPDSTGQPALRDIGVETLCAFVVRGSTAGSNTRPRPDALPPRFPTSVTLVDLGPMEPIERAVREWRRGLGVARDIRGMPIPHDPASPEIHALGVRLREKIFDPLLPALAGAEQVVLALDDVLHLVPFDALPWKDSGALVGDRWSIVTRATLTELVETLEPLGTAGELVAFGDVDYGESADASPLRGSSWSRGFSALPGTGVEVNGIARYFADQFGAETTATLCDHATATRERLVSLAPRARWLHIATHGWFAPESVPSWSDVEPLDAKSGLGMRSSGAEQVKGMSPMLLCGLALADANLPHDEVGRAPGLVTADELSTLDLSNCELAVLSACDTNVGQRRAGQGVASLQRALQMAGARSVITSLWKVPDEATKELMLDFYRRLWVERKPKGQALWEAKRKLRSAKDERGAPIYTTRDWAAWVLTGDPD